MNPFKYGQIVSSKDFCPRPSLTNQLKKFIQADQNVVIQGERRMGKTSLIHEVIRGLKEFRMIYIDLLEVKTMESVSKRILTALVTLERKSSFLKRILNQLSQLRPVLSLDPVSGQPQFSFDAGAKIPPESIEALLELIHGTKGGKRLVVVFDEFQGLLNLDQSREILGLMRSQIQFHSDICYIFSGSIRHQMNRIFDDPDSAFYKSAIPINVGPIDPEDFLPFLEKKFNADGRNPKREILRKAMEIADHIPGDIQALCSCIWDTTHPGDQISNENIQPALELIYARESKGYEPILATLTKIQFKCLVGIARYGGKAPYSNEFRQKIGILSHATVQKSLNRLCQLHIIYRFNTQYRFINPFFKSWLIWKAF